AEAQSFADVDHLALAVPEHVDARAVGNGLQPSLDRVFEGYRHACSDSRKPSSLDPTFLRKESSGACPAAGRVGFADAAMKGNLGSPSLSTLAAVSQTPPPGQPQTRIAGQESALIALIVIVLVAAVFFLGSLALLHH